MQSFMSGLRHWFSPPQAGGEMRRGSVQCLSSGVLHRMAYTEWGEPTNPRVLLCVHGLTRNARDFDPLARALADHYRVICPDVAGRGESDWLPNPADYGVPTYVQHMLALLAQLGIAQVDWVGTSMGGLIGMSLAALPNAPIRKLVLNDAGAVVSARSLQRIAGYVGLAPDFADLAEAEIYMRRTYAGFGALTDKQWRFLTEHALRPLPGGGWRMRYDPAIGEAMRASPILFDLNLWQLYDAIRAQTVLLRGAESDLLSHDTAAEMALRGPRAHLVEIPGVGHAPMLMDDIQIAIVRNFLLSQ